MKVVIDIPENDYKLACNYPDALIACYAHYIKAGVPLPKKHGRLIDADELKTEFPKDTDWGYPVNTNEYVCEMIDKAQAVIEAEDGT
jgi:hypothetical protein